MTELSTKRVSSTEAVHLAHEAMQYGVFLVLPMALFVFLGVLSLLQNNLLFGALWLLAGLICGALALALGFSVMKRPNIDITDSHLIISRGKKREEIPWSQVDSVSQRGLLILIRFKEATIFGSVIRFEPIWSTQISLLTPRLPWIFKTHPILDELQVLARQGQE